MGEIDIHLGKPKYVCEECQLYMEYDIRNFDESYLEDQVSIGDQVIKKYWRGLGQTPIERLKQIYSLPNFDPKSKFYAFHDNELVGFLTSKIEEGDDDEKTARMEFPLVLDTHRAAEKLLIDSCLSYLKNNGVSIVYSRAGEKWGNSLDHVRDYGFDRDHFRFRYGIIYPEKVRSEDLDPETDEDSIFLNFIELVEDRVKNHYINDMGFSGTYYTSIKKWYDLDSPDRRSWSFILEDDVIIASGRIAIDTYGGRNLIIERVRTGYDKNKYKRKMANYLIKRVLQLNISQIGNYIDVDEDTKRIGESYGAKYNTVYMYKLSLA